ncbi:hypothetical protein B0A48_08658 [Cryoendolithus antarcticus]|uniref:SET domain-containing protein n=1 Tax=Cryoendolithus antarcticus TaxID=1507870 RepID=A0A1V8T3Z9_9PEZI|nr:hypothetical protein B0A48_08658 [Cryoendolithus antarcticus]
MADEDYGDSGYFYGDDDYLYVEDEYAIADELAENQIPSPGYAGTNNEIDDGEDYDIYEYFGELEYGDDTCWDAEVRPPAKDAAGKSDATKASTAKRKRSGPRANEEKCLKRRKTAPDGTKALENVVYKRFGDRLPPTPPISERRVSFALLPDWKERFRDVEEVKIEEKAMPVEMKAAAEGKAEVHAMVEEEGVEGEWEDEEEGEGDEDDPLGELYPAALKVIMKQRLVEETGLALDDAMVEKMIEQMLSGSADDAAGSMADMLLGQVGENEDSQASKWLAGKGVRLEEEEDPEEATLSSQPDSAVGMAAGSPLKTVAAIEGEEVACETGAVSSRKRKTPSDEGSDHAPGSSRAKRRQASGTLPSATGTRSVAKRHSAPWRKAKKLSPDRDLNAGLVQKAVKETALGTKFFEVQYAGAKGLGAFALQNISVSTCILAETPIMIVRKNEADIDRRDVMTAYKKLTVEKKKEFDALRDDRHREADDQDTPRDDTNQGFRSNKHSISDSRTGINGAGAYHLSSMFNHSCRPNATFHYDDDGTRLLYALENIKADQEITFAYISRVYYLSTEERSDALEMDCRCELCDSPPMVRYVSDKRRFMLRALHEFIHREDPAGLCQSLPMIKGFWMKQEEINELARLKPEERQQWNTLYFFIVAKLLEVEGIITDITITSYARSAINIVLVADDAGRSCLSPRELENVKLCTQRSEKMARKTGYMEYDGDDRMRRFWYAMREVLLAIGPNGEIPELEKVASHAGGMRGLKKGKGIKGTLRALDF